MPEPLDDAGLERLTQETHAAIEELRVSGTDAEAQQKPVEVVTVAAEGRIRVAVTRGRVRAVLLDPRTKRMNPKELAGYLKAAVNAALTEYAKRVPSGGPIPDIAGLADDLARMQNEELRSIEQMTQGIAESMDQVRQDTGITGDPSTPGLEHLMAQMSRTVAALGDAIGARPVKPAEVSENGVRVVATPGRLVLLELAPRATQIATEELAESLARVINEALDDLESQAMPAGGDLSALEEQAQELQDTSMRQMMTYTRALRDIMTSIQGPDE